MRRSLGDGFELDDDRGRIDVDAVHSYISGESYWGRGRPRDLVERTVEGSSRVVGLYHEGRQVGFARVVTDRATIGYLADVYVLEPYRGRGLGVELVREAVDGDAGAQVRWMLHTADAQGLYRKLGFSEDPPAFGMMERARGAGEDRRRGRRGGQAGRRR